jgi:hypothetical protein
MLFIDFAESQRPRYLPKSSSIPCGICEQAFESGTCVSVSRNPDCGDYFHTACIVLYLNDNHDSGSGTSMQCPNCPHPFLVHAHQDL